MRYVLMIVLLSSWGLPGAGAQEKGVAEPAPAADLDRIQQSIKELGANRFDVRDQAMQALIASGKSAVQPALLAAHGADREVALRSVIALQEIGARGDTETLQAALAALDDISRRGGSPAVARQAADARVTLTIVRQERGIEYLQGLGAVISRQAEDQWYQQVAGFHVSVFTAEIGPQWRGTEKDLERLSWIQDLEQVSFVGPQVKDSWFEYLRNLPKLNSVKIKRANISNAGVETLAGIEGIWFLRLLYVPLDDTSVPLLEKSKSIRKLVFISRNLSEDGMKRLRDHYGNDNVDCPGGALLGITADVANGPAWRVSRVIEGGAAAKAGILENDRIVTFNGQPVPDFLILKSMIAQYKPGDTVTVEIERGLEKLVKQITFGEWE